MGQEVRKPRGVFLKVTGKAGIYWILPSNKLRVSEISLRVLRSAHLSICANIYSIWGRNRAGGCFVLPKHLQNIPTEIIMQMGIQSCDYKCGSAQVTYLFSQ